MQHGAPTRAQPDLALAWANADVMRGDDATAASSGLQGGDGARALTRIRALEPIEATSHADAPHRPHAPPSRPEARRRRGVRLTAAVPD